MARLTSGITQLTPEQKALLRSTGVKAGKVEKIQLDESDLEHIIDFQIAVSETALAQEQQQGDLLDYNRYVDRRLNKDILHVKPGGRVEYQALSDLRELIAFIDSQLEILVPVDKSRYRDNIRLKDNIRWIVTKGNRNSETVKPTHVDPYTVGFLDQTETLVVYPNLYYARFVEFGTNATDYTDAKGKKRRGWSGKNGHRAQKFMHRTMRRAKTKFGETWGMRHVLIHTKEIGIDRKKKPKPFYDRRWKLSYPAIKIWAKKGTKHFVSH